MIRRDWEKSLVLVDKSRRVAESSEELAAKRAVSRHSGGRTRVEPPPPDTKQGALGHRATVLEGSELGDLIQWRESTDAFDLKNCNYMGLREKII